MNIIVFVSKAMSCYCDREGGDLVDVECRGSLACVLKIATNIMTTYSCSIIDYMLSIILHL